jgi:VanZ family protein
LFRYLEEHKIFLVYVPLIVYWLILIAATSVPVDSVPSFGIGDKIKHFSAYFVLASLLYLTLLFQQKSIYLRKYSAIFTVLIAVTYGAIDEIHQMFIPGRFAELLDWLADFGGAISGVIVLQIVIKSKKFIPEESGA